MPWPSMPMMRDPMMPVPQMGPQAFDMREMMQQPLYTQPQLPPSRFTPSPGFADFLRNYYLNRPGL